MQKLHANGQFFSSRYIWKIQYMAKIHENHHIIFLDFEQILRKYSDETAIMTF